MTWVGVLFSVKVLTIHLETQHIPSRHLPKRKSWIIIGLFYVPLEFQPKTKNWIFHRCIGYLNCIRVHTNNDILLGLPSAPRNFLLNYQHLFHTQSKTGYKVIVKLPILEWGWSNESDVDTKIFQRSFRVHTI